MLFFYKLILSALVIAGISELAKQFPSLGGLIAAMPITTLLTLFWLNYETGDLQLIEKFTISVFWGIFPSIIFFLVAIYFFKKGFSFYTTIGFSLLCFMVIAMLHRKFLPD